MESNPETRVACDGGREQPWRDADLLRELYVEQRFSQVEIAERLDCGDSTVSNWLRHHGIERDETEEYPWRDAETLRELYWEDGRSVEGVSEELETDIPTVHRWMVRLDVPRRPSSQEITGPWQDAETLRALYHEEGLTQAEIGERLDCSQATVKVWMRTHGIETDDSWKFGAEAKRVARAFFYTTPSGYEMWGARYGDTTERVAVHRLVAVAEHGFEAVAGNVVHHKNNISFDNRPENLQVLSDSEHKRLHALERYDPESGEFR